MFVHFSWHVPDVAVYQILKGLRKVLHNGEDEKNHKPKPEKELHQLDVKLSVICEKTMSESHNYEPKQVDKLTLRG